MNKIVYVGILVTLISCSSTQGKEKEHLLDNDFNKSPVTLKSKSSAELMEDAENLLLVKREEIDQLISSLNNLFLNKYGLKEGQGRKELLDKSQQLFVLYKDQMRDLYFFDSTEYGSGWTENENRYLYVIAFLDFRINQLRYLKKSLSKKK